MNTYLYKVTDLQRDISDGIVVSASFTITASNEVSSFTHNYQTAFPSPKENLIPYNNLTEFNVITWIKQLVGAQCEEQADAELNSYIKRSANTINNGTPWN